MVSLPAPWTKPTAATAPDFEKGGDGAKKTEKQHADEKERQYRGQRDRADDADGDHEFGMLCETRAAGIGSEVLPVVETSATAVNVRCAVRTDAKTRALDPDRGTHPPIREVEPDGPEPNGLSDEKSHGLSLFPPVIAGAARVKPRYAINPNKITPPLLQPPPPLALAAVWRRAV